MRSCFGRSSTLFGRPLLDHPALVHEHDAVGDLAGKAHLVGDHHHGHARFSEAADHREHFADQFGIERGGRLIEQHQPRRNRQRAGDRHPLLLPAGQPVRQMIGMGRQTDSASRLTPSARILTAASP